MIFLLDTNAVSDWMRENSLLLARLAAGPASDQIVTCAIVRGEILHGINRLPQGRRKDNLAARAALLFGVVVCESITEIVADYYARIKFEQERRGLSLDENDLWIAAIAQSVDATVVTRDRDIARVAGLKVIDWTV